MSDRVLTMNEKDTLTTAVATLDLSRVLRIAKPTLGGLEEWNKPRDKATRALLTPMGYGYQRGPRGGGPVFWDGKRYLYRNVRSVRLSMPELVGHIPGRRDRLGSSWATEVTLTDLDNGAHVVILAAHLTAEIEDATHGGYKTDLAHRLRVLRHKREKHRLGKRARRHKRAGRRVIVLGDTNYNRMPLGGFISCWDGHDGGSLGWRAVDIVYTDQPARYVHTYTTHSDHNAVLACY